MLARGDVTLWPSGPGSSAARTLADGSVPAPAGRNRIVVEVDNLPAAMASLAQTGARFRSEPVSCPGGTHVPVEDPSGSPIELFRAR